MTTSLDRRVKNFYRSDLPRVGLLEPEEFGGGLGLLDITTDRKSVNMSEHHREDDDRI